VEKVSRPSSLLTMLPGRNTCRRPRRWLHMNCGKYIQPMVDVQPSNPPNFYRSKPQFASTSVCRLFGRHQKFWRGAVRTLSPGSRQFQTFATTSTAPKMLIPFPIVTTPSTIKQLTPPLTIFGVNNAHNPLLAQHCNSPPQCDHLS